MAIQTYTEWVHLGGLLVLRLEYDDTNVAGIDPDFNEDSYWVDRLSIINTSGTTFDFGLHNDQNRRFALVIGNFPTEQNFVFGPSQRVNTHEAQMRFTVVT